MQPIVKLVIAGTAMFATLGLIAGLSGMYSLNIKAKTVGHGQHGTARWATKGEIKKTYVHVPFEPELWRKGEHLPTEQGIVVGCLTKRHRVGNPFALIFLKGSDRIDNTCTIQLTEIQYAALLDRAAELEISLEDFILQAIQNQIKEVDPHA